MFEGKKVQILLANAGTGKGNWVECKVPTPQGIRRFGDLKEGDYVFDRLGFPTKILKVYPRGFMDAYKVTLSDGRSTVVSLDHLWNVYRGVYSKEIYTLELGQMLSEGVRKEDNRPNRVLGSPRFYVPSHCARQHEEKKVTVDPYVYGAFIGNGCLTSDYLEFSSDDEETVNKVALLMGFDYKKRSVHNYTWDFFKNGRRVRTTDYFTKAYAKDKYIPDCYKYNSIQTRWELLRGLFDTDGSAVLSEGRLHVSYSTISKRLAEDIKEVLNSLGIVSHIYEDKRDSKNICYNVNVNTTKENKCLLFSLTRKNRICEQASENRRHYDRVAIRSIEKLPEKLEINCIWVDNKEHLYQCDEGIVTHNTRRLIEEVSKELETRRPEELAFVTFTRKGAEEGLRRVCSKLMFEPEDLPYFRTLHSLTFHALNLKGTQMFGRLDQRKFNKEFGYNVNRCEVDTGKVAPTRDSLYLDFYDMERSGALTSKQLAEADIEKAYYNQIVRNYEAYKAREEKVDFFDCLIKYVENGEALPVKVAMIDECFSPDTKVRMADMSVKEIKDIKVGDFVMGTNGATKVTAVHKGTDTMYDVVTGKKQKLFTCNSQHLILQKSEYSTVYTWKHCEDIKRRSYAFTSRSILENNYLPDLDPYFFGLWLGNGFSREAVVVCNENDLPTINWLKSYGESLGDKVTLRKRKGIVQVEYAVQHKGKALKCEVRKRLESYGFLLSKTVDNVERTYKDKVIPSCFMQMSVARRLALLAGLIDSDGMYVKSGSNYKYRIEMARKELMLSIYDLVASLGYYPTWYETEHTTNGVARKYYRVDFFGSRDIPCLLQRKQYKRDPYENKLPCSIVKKGEGEYVGITVEAEDHLFVLANGVIVHNCQDITALQWRVIEKAFRKAEKIIIAGDDKQSIYTYSGARPDFLIQLSKQFPVEHLSKSYRIPYSVYKLSVAITNFIGEKTEQKAEPRMENGEGMIMQLNGLERILNFLDESCIKNDPDKTAWYILARNNCFLEEPKKVLEEALIPYWTADGFFMGGEIMKRLKDYENFKMEGYRDPKKKEDFQRKFGIEDFTQPFTETNLFTEGRKWVYASYIEKYGLKKLEEMCKWNPQVLVSTIHHVKGGEAKNVAIMLDTTRKTKGNVFENIDEELRILYVGVTRAKENLFLIDSKNGEGYDKILEVIRQENGLVW